eukprot:12374662-Heterocapsa_arctica.AAC.1
MSEPLVRPVDVVVVHAVVVLDITAELADPVDLSVKPCRQDPARGLLATPGQQLVNPAAVGLKARHGRVTLEVVHVAK